jgi:hypothetical protein
MCLSSGIIVHGNPKTGQKAPTIRQIMDGTAQLNLAGIVSPDGSDALGVGGRFLLPATILQLAESSLMQDNTSYEQAFAGLVASTVAINTPRYDTPVINLNAPRNSRAQQISQGAEPDLVASISMSEVSQRMPVKSALIEITDEAARNSAIDIVGITLREQLIGEQAAAIDADLVNIVAGSTELGTSALSSETATSYDATLNNVAGALSHNALIKWLSKNYKYLAITHLLGDINAYLSVENRSGRPVESINPGVGRVDTSIVLTLPGLVNPVSFFRTDPALLGANTIIGVDKNKAIRKIVYTGGNYSAVEQFVLRRVTAFRYDYSVRYERIFQDGRGFQKLTLT